MMAEHMARGYFTFVLHSHIPYVIGHGSWPHGMDWLNEACAESYIPILNALNELVEEKISPKLTLGLTPVLTEMLADDRFRHSFVNYLEMKIRAASMDAVEFQRAGKAQLLNIAKFWERYYSSILDDFKFRHNSDLVVAFRRLQDEGHIEIITSAATHGYLPLLGEDTSVQGQVKVGVETYRRHFGRRPRGIWLPECAYRPGYLWSSPVDGRKSQRKGVEEFLSENELEYFIIDSHLLKGGKAIGVYLERFEALRKLWSQFEKQHPSREEDGEKERSPYEAYLVGSASEKKPVAIFTRDPKTGVQVWSGEWGYPGDGNYLDFHKKHFPGGHRYWRVTNPKADLADKQEYEPEKALERVPEHAGHFKNLVKSILAERMNDAGRDSIVVAPYDTELLGHWWFEGTRWLHDVLKFMANDKEIGLVTCSEFLDTAQPSTVVSLPEGSWGEGGFHWIWLNEWTKWTWSKVYDAEKEMRELAQEFGKNEKVREILTQAARELLLLESSDWQFLITTWTARDYSEMRVSEHYQNFKMLANLVRKCAKDSLGPEDWYFISDCKKKDSVFRDIDIGWWAGLE